MLGTLPNLESLAVQSGIGQGLRVPNPGDAKVGIEADRLPEGLETSFVLPPPHEAETQRRLRRRGVGIEGDSSCRGRACLLPYGRRAVVLAVGLDVELLERAGENHPGGGIARIDCYRPLRQGLAFDHALELEGLMHLA